MEGQLPELYYFTSWKYYSEAEDTWEPVLAVMHLEKIISIFYKDNLEKLTVISLLIDSAPCIAKLSTKPLFKIVK